MSEANATSKPGRKAGSLDEEIQKAAEKLRRLQERQRDQPALHTVPAVGYQVSSEGGSLVFSGDTAYSEPLIAAINEIPDLRYLIIETAFPDALHDLALASRHLCPCSGALP